MCLWLPEETPESKEETTGTEQQIRYQWLVSAMLRGKRQ